MLTREESARLERGLGAVARRLGDGTVTPLPSDEDVHTLIDRLLTEEICEPAARLHTGRSRNDQVALDLRLFARDAAEEIKGGVLAAMDVRRRPAVRRHERLHGEVGAPGLRAGDEEAVHVAGAEQGQAGVGGEMQSSP